MKPKRMNPATAKAWAYNEAYGHFQNYTKAEQASELYMIGLDFCERPPIGWNCDYTKETVEAKLTQHLKANYKPRGFLPAIGLTWLFWSLFSGVIGWVVRKLMDRYYPDLI